MRARVERGKILIDLVGLEKEERLAFSAKLIESIGSAKASGGGVEVSCDLSINNFRKLKKHGCKLSQDDHTLEVVKQLGEDLKAFEAESKHGQLAKAGELFFAGAEGRAAFDASSYKFQRPPFDHQILGWLFLHALKNPALFGDAGSGKTFIVLTHAESLIQANQKWCLLVLCPVNLISHVWLDDAVKFTRLTAVSLREPLPTMVRAADFDREEDPPNLSYRERAALRKKRREDPEESKTALALARRRRAKMVKDRFASNADIYAINPENARADATAKALRALIKRRRKEGYEWCLVIDESSRIKSKASATYKLLRKLRELCARCIIMTGTPSPNGLPDLWAQFHILDGGMTLQPSFTDYRHEVCIEFPYGKMTYEDKNGNKHQVMGWTPRPGAALAVYDTISPRMIRFKTDECLDLPPYRFVLREVEMNKDQELAYNTMEDRLFLELDGEPVTARVAVAKLMKLREITGGFLVTDARKATPIGKKGAPKMFELDQMLEQTIGNKLGDNGPPSKAIVWAQYRWECESLVKRYSKAYGARGLFGGISSTAKDRTIRDFQTGAKPRLIVCHPQSVGHGLTLTAANFIFYYSLSHNFEEFYQSFRRTMRAGQTRPVTYFFLVSPGTVDEEILQAMIRKKDLSDLVTDGKFDSGDFLRFRERSDVSTIKLDWEVPDVSDSSSPAQQ